MKLCHQHAQEQQEAAGETLTRLHGHTPPRSGQTHPGGEDPRWTSLWSNTQSYPLSQPQTGSASGREINRRRKGEWLISAVVTEEQLWGIAVVSRRDPSASASRLSPGRSWRTWRRQSRSRQSRSHSHPRGPSPAPQGPSHTFGPPGRTTWSPATILPWRSCTWKHRTAWWGGGGTCLEDCGHAARSLVRKRPPAIGIKDWF